MRPARRLNKGVVQRVGGPAYYAFMDVQYLKLSPSVLFRHYEAILGNLVSGLEGRRLVSSSPKLDYYKQEFLKLFLVYMASIRSLYPAVTVQHKGSRVELSSAPSVLPLLRSALEAYAVYHFIYVDSADEATVDFRFWSWWREGLIRRQALPGLTAETRDKQRAELDSIRAIAQEQAGNAAYQLLTTKQQKRYSSQGTWCMLSKAGLLESAGFSRTYASAIYGHLSTHTHASAGGLLQDSQMHFDTATGMTNTLLHALFAAAACFALSQIRLFPDLGGRLAPVDLELCESWARFARTVMAQQSP